jgi:hypothetical protein
MPQFNDFSFETFAEIAEYLIIMDEIILESYKKPTSDDDLIYFNQEELC